MKRHILFTFELLQKPIRAYPSRTFFYGSDIEEEKLREALAQYAQGWADEIDPSVTAVGVKKAFASRSDVTALDRVEAPWSSLEEYFAFNACIEGVFRDSRAYHPGGAGGGVTPSRIQN